MNIIIKTKTGQEFSFNEVNGKTYVVQNYLKRGLLVGTLKFDPCKDFEVKVQEINLCDFKPSEKITIWKCNSPIVKIEIG